MKPITSSLLVVASFEADFVFTHFFTFCPCTEKNNLFYLLIWLCKEEEKEEEEDDDDEMKWMHINYVNNVMGIGLMTTTGLWLENFLLFILVLILADQSSHIAHMSTVAQGSLTGFTSSLEIQGLTYFFHTTCAVQIVCG